MIALNLYAKQSKNVNNTDRQHFSHKLAHSCIHILVAVRKVVWFYIKSNAILKLYIIEYVTSYKCWLILYLRAVDNSNASHQPYMQSIPVLAN